MTIYCLDFEREVKAIESIQLEIKAESFNDAMKQALIHLEKDEEEIEWDITINRKENTIIPEWEHVYEYSEDKN